MCNFISAIVMENGDVICDPEHTDSHEELLASFNIRDGHAQWGRFARIEFIPPDESTDIADVTNWKLKLDESSTPDWWTFDFVAKVQRKMTAIVHRMIVNNARSILLGGCWILVKGASVKMVKNARIWRIYDSSKVEKMCDSSKVEVMCDSSKVEVMCGSSKVEEMCDSSKVDRMYGSSNVGGMYDSSKVERMYDFSKVERMYDSSKVGVMFDSAKIIERH